MSAPPDCRRRASRSARRPAAAVCLLAISWLLLSACSNASDAPQRAAPVSREPEPSEEKAAADAKPQEVRQSTGKREALALSGVLMPAGAEAAKKAHANAPDTGSLSELEYQRSQSLNQRANEAFGYLGQRAFATAAEPPLAKSPPAPAESRARERRDALRDARTEFDRGRNDADGYALRDRNVVGGLLGQDELAAPRRGSRFRAADHEAEVQALSPAQRFQRERSSWTDVTFQPAEGYWANTFVPGDPVMRWLESRLEQRDRAALQAFSARPLLLDAAARQTPQPFDPPGAAAISLFLQSDRRGLERESRILVQVGLQGANRHAGLRPAMQIGIVLDLRGEIGLETAAAMRALVEGFLKAKDVGDRFSLTVAGRPGVLVGPDAFRHGPISLAMTRLIEPAGSAATSEPLLSLDEAVRNTIAGLRRSDDPSAPLGSSLLLLVTSQPLGPHTAALSAIAHESALAGVPVSVVGIGDALQLDELEQVALAGQGNRRLMHAPAEAERLVERELSSLARVIARALRMRIRLAPNVKLIEVVGAERLDTAGAEQVRQAERSLDRRLARNLGIESDRGDDEEGIQIVIPTFYSGDAHAVLLDVVAPGPGPIADVTVRYKDLVHLRNSVARANLTLGRTTGPTRPLERNVVKNYLAMRLSGVLKDAGQALMAGGDQQTIALVRDFQALLHSLQREVPGFQNDVDLANDARLLGEYLALLESGGLQQAEPRLYLADSLQLSGYLKTVPRSLEEPVNRGR